MNKLFKISFIGTIAVIAVYITLLFLYPSFIIQKIIGLNFRDPASADAFFYRNFVLLIILGIIITIILWLKESKYKNPLLASYNSLIKKGSSVLSLKYLFFISFLYLVILFYIAITHYDLGFDEAWCIYYAKNFASTGIPFYTDNGKIAQIDNIAMLPHYLFSLINFKLGLTDIIYFKILSSVFSVITLIILFRVTRKFYNRTIAVLSFVFLIAQPGFGFIASSYFGELVTASFLFLGLFYWFRNNQPYENKTIYLVSLLFTLAIHTKFQLIVILIVTLICLQLIDKNIKAIKVLIYTILFTVALIIIRTIPVYISDPKLLRNLLLVVGIIGDNTTKFSIGYAFDKLQLFNRFFPLPVILLVLGVFFFYMRNAFERFLFLFTSITFFWWIFFYHYSTYRNPFMGFITLSIIIAVLLNKLFEKTDNRKVLAARYVTGIAVIIFLMYGFSANIIYAYVGYNDGVQFDLDGTRSRLFTTVKEDNSQKEFYNELNKIAVGADTLYNGSFVTYCYMDNPVADIQKLKESIQTNPARKLLLITRERYPEGLESGRKILDSLNATWKLVLKKNDYELYQVKK